MNYHHLESMVPPNKLLFLALSFMGITDSVHSATGTYFATIDLGKSALLMPMSTVSAAVGLHLQRERTHLYLVPFKEAQHYCHCTELL